MSIPNGVKPPEKEKPKRTRIYVRAEPKVDLHVNLTKELDKALRTFSETRQIYKQDVVEAAVGNHIRWTEACGPAAEAKGLTLGEYIDLALEVLAGSEATKDVDDVREMLGEILTQK